jgi:hypothetical protein
MRFGKEIEKYGNVRKIHYGWMLCNLEVHLASWK